MTPIEKIARLLKSQTTLALATSAKDGAPRVAPLFYLSDDDLRLYWFSSGTSEHAANLEANPDAAVAVYRPAASWREIRGVQMRGAVSAVRDAARRQAIGKAYAERFRLGKPLQAEMARSELYVFEPNWIRYIDNSRGFGQKFEVRVGL